VAGTWSPLIESGDVFVYLRQHGGRRLLVALNMGPEPGAILLPNQDQGHILVSTHLDREGETVSDEIGLRGDEGVVVRLA
jgi:alpha-glucosidase